MISKRAFCSLLKYTKATNPRVWMTIHDGENDLGNLEFELYSNHAPQAAENFRSLCTIEEGGYAGSTFDTIINGFIAQGGDTGGESIYPPNSEHGDMWGKFRDETPFLMHSRKGLLSMANNGKTRTFY